MSALTIILFYMFRDCVKKWFFFSFAQRATYVIFIIMYVILISDYRTMQYNWFINISIIIYTNLFQMLKTGV